MRILFLFDFSELGYVWGQGAHIAAFDRYERHGNAAFGACLGPMAGMDMRGLHGTSAEGAGDNGLLMIIIYPFAFMAGLLGRAAMHLEHLFIQLD
jgi:hypothetical protein